MALARIDVGIEDSRGRVLARAAQHEGAVWWAVQLRGARVATGIVPDPPGKTRDVPAWLRGRVRWQYASRDRWRGWSFNLYCAIAKGMRGSYRRYRESLC